MKKKPAMNVTKATDITTAKAGGEGGRESQKIK